MKTSVWAVLTACVILIFPIGFGVVDSVATATAQETLNTVDQTPNSRPLSTTHSSDRATNDGEVADGERQQAGATTVAATDSVASMDSGSQGTVVEDMRSGEPVDLNRFVEKISGCDVLFLGELHNNDAGHQFQLEVIQELVRRGVPVAISLEQFERDVQGAVDDYLAGRIEEDEFREVSRPWPNYQNHYRPIIEFAKENGLPVIASNVPRRIARQVAADETVSPADVPYLPRTTSAPENGYWEKFRAQMEGHMMMDTEMDLQAFYRSQCLKDDAMAEAISDFMAVNLHQPKLIVHLCGKFHSDYGFGTVSRLQQRSRLSNIVVVSMEEESTDDDSAELRARAHYILRTKPDNPQENPNGEDSSGG